MDSEAWDVTVEELEGDLRQSLRHVPAPDGFTMRVMDRVQRRQGAASTGSVAVRSRFPWRGGSVFAARPGLLAAAAVLVLSIAGGDLLHVRHQRQAREAAAAQAEVDLAMQLAGHALAQVQIGLDRSPAGRFTQLLSNQ